MFLERFGFQEHPFPDGPDPACLFVGRAQEEALAHLRYAVSEGEGFSVITGEPGVGKTTLCRAFAGRLRAEHEAALLSGPLRTPAEFLSALNRQLGVAAPSARAGDQTGALNRFLMERKIAGRRVVVLIDNAQDLPPAVLEQVRLLSNLETTRDKLILIVLIGDPGLEALLHSPKLRQMGQRVSVACRLGPLDEQETGAYIAHKLACRPPRVPLSFPAEAVHWVFRSSGGIPAKVNQACTAVLNAVCQAGLPAVGGEMARAALFGPPPAQQAFLRNAAVRLGGGRPFAAAFAAAGVLALGVLFFSLRGGQPTLPAGDAAVVKALPEEETRAAEEGVGTAASPAENPAPHPADAARGGTKARGPSFPPSAAAASGLSWSVQVGAFLQPENARRAASEFTGRGWPARIAVFRDGKGRTWHTVRIGDHADRGKAEAQAEEFLRREGKPVVVRPYGAL